MVRLASLRRSWVLGVALAMAPLAIVDESSAPVWEPELEAELVGGPDPQTLLLDVQTPDNSPETPENGSKPVLNAQQASLRLQNS